MLTWFITDVIYILFIVAVRVGMKIDFCGEPVLLVLVDRLLHGASFFQPSSFTQAASAVFTQLLSRLQNSIPDHAVLPITSIQIPWPFLQCSQLNTNNELPGKALVCYSWVLCQVSKFVRGCLCLLPVPTQQAFSFPRLRNTEVAKCTCHSGALIRGDGSLVQQNWDCLRVTG